MSDLMLANSTYASGTNDTATTLVNNVSSTDAQQMNGVASAVVQIETVLGSGTTLIGSKADLATRLGIQVGSDGIINPVGAIHMYGGSSAPTGWLLCDGSAVSRTTYANLFTVISTTWGSGDGSTTFNVPDMRGRVPVGVGTGTGGGASGTGAPTGGSALTAIARGTWKGEETHTLTAGESGVGSHNHTATFTGSAQTIYAAGALALPTGASDNTNPTGTFTPAGSISVASTSAGASSAHNNIQPVMGLNFIIKT